MEKTTANIRELLCTILPMAISVNTAVFFIRHLNHCMRIYISYLLKHFFYLPERKKFTQLFIHDRKHSCFTVIPDGNKNCPGNEGLKLFGRKWVFGEVRLRTYINKNKKQKFFEHFFDIIKSSTYMNRLFNLKNIAVAAIFALTGVVGLSAFTNSEKNNKSERKLVKQWFTYNGTTTAGQNNNLNYTEYTQPGEPEDCGGVDMRCAIFADPVVISGVTRPDLSTIDDTKTKLQPLPQQ
ncbi:hypothetical protein [Pedobacter kyonggii]|uniref:Uncharacterized protein n=1 Tax=Pedobacter kyonggii TaxID=1926871 RepID=A0A4Q9HGE9_9SPHI|nr:hypothetical protein [Pedobacter kyonggii]TBO44308.1 hypothetical protein EYS08_03065 [Pedobacter kyonggii]